MYLLYIDESGSAGDARQRYFVLAGVCIFERQGYWISSQLSEIAKRFNPADPQSVELHGNPMFGGKKFWRQFDRESRFRAIEDSLNVLAASHRSNRIFACVIEKSSLSPADPVEFAFEQLASRFDYFLIRQHNRRDTHRGLMIFDKSTYENTLQNLATDFQTIGHTWGVLRNLAEVPLFLDSNASRLIQLADLVAYAIYRHFESGDSRFYNLIAHRFDTEGGVQHGLFLRS